VSTSPIGVLETFDVWAMRQALVQAHEALRLGEIPVGAVLVRSGRILAQAHNLRETLNDPTAHAERLVLTLGGKALGTWRLEGCQLYVTLEPCPMCAGAIVLSRLDRVIYGTTDPKAGACDSLYRLVSDPRLNHRVKLTGGLLKDECRTVLSEFFQQRRPPKPADDDCVGPDSEGCLSG
jgi:tRNA(adenine34) deaminase